MEPGNFWGSWLVAILAMYSIFAPTIWKYTDHIVATANAGVTGGLIFMFAFWVIPTDEAWASWVNVGLGAWMVASAIAFERSVTAGLVNGIVTGLVIMLVAALTARHGRAVWRRGFELIERGEGYLR